MSTFGGIAGFVLPEPGKVFVFKPGDVGVVVCIVLLFRPFRHGCRFVIFGGFRKH